MKQLEKLLKQMENGRYQYANNIHHVKKIVIDSENEKFEITTDLNVFSRKFESGLAFLKYWKPAEDDQQIVTYTGKENGLADEMIAILKDNIKKVQANPNYVKQATTINSNVSSIINVIKVKMAFAKQIGKRGGYDD